MGWNQTSLRGTKPGFLKNRMMGKKFKLKNAENLMFYKLNHKYFRLKIKG